MRHASVAALLFCAMSVTTRTGLAQRRDTLTIGQKYAGPLRALREADLGTISDGREMYRVLWLRSFHEAIAVRIVKDGTRYSVITSVGPVGGREDSAPPRRDSMSLEPRAWAALQLRTALRDFWHLTAPVNRNGLDGAEWILEGRRGGVYHAVDWWSPRPVEGHEGDYRHLFLDILSLGTDRVMPNAVY